MMNNYIKIENIQELLLVNSVEFICEHYQITKEHLHNNLFKRGFVIPEGSKKLMYKDSAFINFLKLWWKNFYFKNVNMDDLISMALKTGYFNDVMRGKKKKLGYILSKKIRNGFVFKGKIIEKHIGIKTNVEYSFQKI